MSYHEPSADDFLQLDPEPDDEAWEAYLDFVMPLIGSVDANGLDASAMARLEEALGVSVPYEVGLFLTIGVPSSEGWWRWAEGAHEQLERWAARLADMFAPETIAAAPALLPLFEDCAAVVGVAAGASGDSRNPILRLADGAVSVTGEDLAAWLHREFDAPLPMWPAPPARSLGVWSDLIAGSATGDEGASME